jgi:soluble lytic murein transglycosylase-like protein
MRVGWVSVLAALLGLLVLPVSAGAHVTRSVQPGETLWGIAQANGLSTSALAAANGLDAEAHVVAGTTVAIPAPGQAQPAAAPPPPPLGAYTVQPGDSLSAIAARSRIPMQQLAWMNGLDPQAPLLAGTPLKLPAGAPAPAQPQATPTVVPGSAPNPTPGRVTADQIGEIAATHGVTPSLAAAVAWQESGFNNGLVSRANARGVMQILPGTWDWIQQRLATRPLDPSSPTENVHAGVMYLGQLLRDAGGDPTNAVASYYQGGASVRRIGLLPETQRYVQNVMALRSRFGGP